MNSPFPQREGFHAWVSPGGEVFRVGYYEHDEWIESTLGKSVGQVEKECWLRICDSRIRHHCRITEYQRIALYNLGYYDFDKEPVDDEWRSIRYARGSKGPDYSP